MAVVEAERRLFTIEEFDRLFEVGFFTEDDRVEFIDGEVIWMSSVSGRHVGTIARIDRLAQRAIGERFGISVQSPIRIRGRASFLPDLVVLKTAEIPNEVPAAEIILIVIEVSESSLAYDRNTKLPAYASAGLPEAWICDLDGERIERHTDPAEGAYQHVTIFERGEQVVSAVLPDFALDVNAILG
jgi:Uma2 family endonuclease